MGNCRETNPQQRDSDGPLDLAAMPGSVHVYHRPLAHECLVSWLERHRCLGYP